MEIFDAPPEGAIKPKATPKDAGAPKDLAEHPWVKVQEAAKRGETTEGKNLNDEMLRVLKLGMGLEKPQSADDVLLMVMGAAPIFKLAGLGGGALATAAKAPQAIANAAPLLSRIATAAGLAKARGESNMGAAVDAAGAGVAEGAISGAAKVLGTPSRALDAIRARIGQGPDGPVNLQMLDRLLSWWKADPNTAVQAARSSRVASALNDLDAEGVAGRIFREQVTKGTKVPMVPVRVPPVPVAASDAVREMAGSNSGVRAVADSLFGQPPGSAAAVMAPVAAASVLPGASRVRDVIEHEQ